MITFRSLEDKEEDFIQLHRWCSNKNVYEWFEQRILSLEEIKDKYKRKIFSKEQDCFIIQYDGRDIGYAQIYPYNSTTYEFDLFIGEEDCLSKGIGTKVVKELNKKILKDYRIDSIIARPFSRNTRAVQCYLKSGYQIIREEDGTDTLGNKEKIMVMINNRL